MEDFLESRLALPVSATKHLSRKDARVTECELVLSRHRGPGGGHAQRVWGRLPGSPAGPPAVWRQPSAHRELAGGQRARFHLPQRHWGTGASRNCEPSEGTSQKPQLRGWLKPPALAKGGVRCGPHTGEGEHLGRPSGPAGEEPDPPEAKGTGRGWPSQLGEIQFGGTKTRDPHGRDVAPRELSAPPQSTSGHPRVVWPPTPRLGQPLAGREENSGIGNVSGFSSPTGLLRNSSRNRRCAR